jgi:hypothetical protein
MPLFSDQPDTHQNGPLLLGQVVELLQWELSTLSNRNWEDLPELKRKKVVLASRLGKIAGTPAQTGPELADSVRLKSQISDLEAQSRQKIEGQLQLIDNQILALQELHQYCLECLNVTFPKFQESIPSEQN